MRINVYHEELTDEFKFVEKHVEATGKTYYGFRMYMKSPPELHHTPDDDDRTAITFWFGTEQATLDYFEKVANYLYVEIQGEDFVEDSEE